MLYHNVCLEAFGYTIPDEVVTTQELESRLTPLYERLRLPEGRLELMTGIRERRFWAPDETPGQISTESAAKAIAAAGIELDQIGALVHASVCRDYVEPATAAGVHHRLGLSPECLLYDVSNACLGILNGMAQVANMIELGQIRAGLVVGTESSRHCVESTIHWLNRETSLRRDQIKPAIASLTLGSASVAVLLTDRELSRTDNRLLAATARAGTQHHELCRGGHEGQSLLMMTDSERLMHAGVEVGVATFDAFMAESGWNREDIQKTFCHQVGPTHRKLMLGALQLDPVMDFTTVEWLGNTGSAALPITMALGIEQGRLTRDDHVAMLGIGSGINSLMIAVDWQKSVIEAQKSNLRGPHTVAGRRQTHSKVR